MTKKEIIFANVKKICDTLDIGTPNFGSIEIYFQNGEILDILKQERVRVNN